MLQRVMIGLVGALLGASMLLGPSDAALAQGAVDQREEINKGTVGIISGGVNGTYIRIASDLASVLDEGNDMRILAIRGKGSVQNITDILFLRGIDVGIVQSDVLEFAKRENIYPGITDRIHYITKLYNEEVHLLAHEDITDIADLAGRKVNFGIAGGGTEMTASIIFDTLGIPVEKTSLDQAVAMEKLKTGEIAAQVFVAGKPAAVFRELTADDPARFLEIPLSPDLLTTYLPSRLTAADYPNVVGEEEVVNTLAVGAVMAVYNWDPESYRYRKVSRFIDTFFKRFDEFQQAPRHPKWQEVSLTAQVPGWTRFGAAEDWLTFKTTDPAEPLKEEFEVFLAQSSVDATAASQATKDALFETFLKWREQNSSQ